MQIMRHLAIAAPRSLIIKTSSDRLRQTLLSAAEEETAVAAMDRDALNEAAAKQKLQGPVGRFLSQVRWRNRRKVRDWRRMVVLR